MSELSPRPDAPHRRLGLAGRIAHEFINSKLTPLIIAAALLLGAFAIVQTPREEEPQIMVPMLDVFVQMPGASAEEVKQRASGSHGEAAARNTGRGIHLFDQPPRQSLVIVRFYVGTNEEDAIVKTYNKLYSNFDRIPQGVSQPLIKVRSIDDVPILALTLWGQNYDAYQLRRIAADLEHSLKQLDDVSETTLIGGQPRQLRVMLDIAAPGRLWTNTFAQWLRNSARRTRAAWQEVSRGVTRNFRWRPEIFSPVPTNCKRWWWGFMPGARCICGTLPKSKTGRPSRTTT